MCCDFSNELLKNLAMMSTSEKMESSLKIKLIIQGVDSTPAEERMTTIWK